MNEMNSQTPEMASLLEKLEQTAALQQKYARRQALMITVAALACVGILVLVAVLFTQLQPVVQDMSQAAGNLTSISDQLAAIDLENAVDSLTQGAAKLEELDIDTLNTAIANLAELIAPLARLFGRAG